MVLGIFVLVLIHADVSHAYETRALPIPAADGEQLLKLLLLFRLSLLVHPPCTLHLAPGHAEALLVFCQTSKQLSMEQKAM